MDWSQDEGYFLKVDDQFSKKLHEEIHNGLLLLPEKKWCTCLVFIEYSNFMDDIYENIEQYNANEKQKLLIVFDYVIADILINKKPNLKLSQMFIRRRNQIFFCFY